MIFSMVAFRESVQYYETKEPQDGGGSEEEIGDETPPGGPCRGQENILCQLHRDM